MVYRLLLSFVIVFIALSTNAETIKKEGLELDVFYGKKSTVNAYLFSDGKSLILLDALDSPDDASELISLIKKKELPLKSIFITHGHPDHFIGLNMLNRNFPEAKILVASEDIKQELIDWSHWMRERGWLHDSMMPRSEEHPQGFDYQNLIQVTQKDFLDFDSGKKLRIERDYPPSESQYMATLYSEEFHGLFTGDLAYHNVHLWLGDGVSKQGVENWQSTLQAIIERYKGSGLTIYPGHGEPGTLIMLEEIIEYIDIFKFVIKTSRNQQMAIKKMTILFPQYAEAGFLPFSVGQHFPEI